MLSRVPDYDKYIVKYLEAKREALFQGFRGIAPNMNDSEAKATIMKYEGAIAAIEDILRRFKV